MLFANNGITLAVFAVGSGFSTFFMVVSHPYKKYDYKGY